jgi:hypothetical protein
MSVMFEPEDDHSPWGHVQPRFERLEHEASGGYFLVGRLVSGEPIRVQLTCTGAEPWPT